MAHEHSVLIDHHVFIRDDIGQRSSGFDHRTLHQYAVGHLGTLFYNDAAGEDGVFHHALNIAAVGYQGLDRHRVGPVVGGGVGLILGADGAADVEQVSADLGIQKIHGVLEVVAYRLEAGHIALVDVRHHLQALEPGAQDTSAEAVDIVRGTVLYHIQQQLLGQDVHLQGLQGLVRSSGMDGQIRDPALPADLHILRELRSPFQGGGTHHSHVGPGGDVLLQYLGHGQVNSDIAPAHDNIVLADILKISGYAGQSLHVAPILAASLALISEGGQDAQAAVFAGQVPVLPGSQVIQQRLIALMDHQPHVGDTRVDIAGQHEIDQAVPPAKGQGAGVAGPGQLSQIGVRAIGEENAVEIIHARSPPFTASRTMAPGDTTACSPTVTPLATTAMPHLGSSLGAEPTTAPASMTAASATMA